MNILLDTQFVLWILADGKKIKKRERDLINNNNNFIICSSISIFEISLKYSIGKLKLSSFTPIQVPNLLLENGYEIKNIEYEIFATYHQLPNDIHKDPFDRIMIWEAIKNDFYFLSQDKEVSKYQKYGLKII